MDFNSLSCGKEKCSPLTGLEVQVIPRDAGQIQFALVPHIRRIAGVGVTFAVNEDAVLPLAGRDQQAAEAAGLLTVPGKVGPGGDERGLGQQIRLKAAVFGFLQDDLPHHCKGGGLDDWGGILQSRHRNRLSEKSCILFFCYGADLPSKKGVSLDALII